MDSIAISRTTHAANLKTATTSQEEDHMKKSNAFWLFTVVVALLFTTLPLSAQTTAFESANEVMTWEQSMLTSFIASTFGPDPASPLTFSTYVDPAGQTFNFSLNAGSTYLGKPITITDSGTLTPFSIWTVQSSLSYNGVPLAFDGKYVAPMAVFGSPSSLPPPFSDLPTGVVSSINSGGFCFKCTHILSFHPWSSYNNDGTSSVVFNGAYPAPGSNFGGFSNLLPGSGVWTFGDVIADGNTSYGSGTSPSNGSEGNSTTFTGSVSVSTVSYFSDLGSGASTYQCCTGWPVSGSGSSGGTSYTAANEFIATAGGDVSRIDIGIGDVSGLNSFYASVWTNDNGVPGTELAEWDNLSSNLPSGQCCGVASIPGISGLTLTAGQSYFLVLGPMNINDSSSLLWNENSQSSTGLDLYSTDGGQTWTSNGTTTLGAFDVLSQPQGIQSNANLFTSGESGNVAQIDIAVGYVSGSNSFNVSLWTNNSGTPGTQLAAWNNLTSSTQYGECCGLVTISGISGVSLTAGQQYFLVLSPSSLNSSTSEEWNLNNQLAAGLDVFSLDGGLTWNSRGQMTLGAFDVIGSDAGGHEGTPPPQTTFFSDLGTEPAVYQTNFGWPITGGTGAPQSLITRHKK